MEYPKLKLVPAIPKRGRGRPRHGKSLKVQVSIRIDPEVKAAVIEKHGSVQAWIDFCAKESNSKKVG